FFVQAEDGIRDWSVTGVQTCALPISIVFSFGPTVFDGDVLTLAIAGFLKPAAECCQARRKSLRRSGTQIPDHRHPLRARRDRPRSEERRVGKEGRSRRAPDDENKNIW